jgi:hypothetical protein
LRATPDPFERRATDRRSAGPQPPAPTRNNPAELTHAAASQPPVTSANHDENTHNDSIAAYMEGLLARSRKPKTDGDVCWLPAQSKAPAATSKSESPRAEDATSTDRAAEEPARPPRASGNWDEPSHKHDRVAARADLDNLRSVANTAARSAIANYTSRATREKLMFRAMLLTIGLILGAVLVTSAIWEKGSYVVPGWIALAACAVLGLEMLVRWGLRSVRRSHVSTHLSRSIAADARSKSMLHDHVPSKPRGAEASNAKGPAAAEHGEKKPDSAR